MNIAEYNHALRQYMPADPRATKEEKAAAREEWETITRNSTYSPAHAFAYLEWNDQRQPTPTEQ